jgi:putative aminopeptidase FrvX
VLTRSGEVPAVMICNSTHLRAPRPETFDKANLWLDVGADSPEDVAALGIELLDAVVQHEVGVLAGGRVAEPLAGQRAALRLLAGALASGPLPADVAVAFVAQSQGTTSVPASKGGTGPLGRGGEAVVRRLRPQTTLVVRGAAGLSGPTSGPTPIQGVETQWQALEVRVAHAGTPVELVDDADVAALDAALDALLGGVPSQVAASRGVSMARPDSCEPTGTFGLLHTLVLPSGISGREGPVRDEIRRLLADISPDWQPVEDSAGNLVLTLGDGPQVLAFAAHMDEIGIDVTKLREDGLLEGKRVGGLIESLFRETVIELVTADGKVLPGISCPTPKDAPKPAPNAEPLFVLDVGARSGAEAAKLGVALGDLATVPKELNALGAHRAAGRANDDRVGCAALLLALRELGPDADSKLRDAGRRVVFAWTTREEVGLEGADVLARNLRPVPDVAFAVDTFVTSDSPMEDPRYAFAKLGGGPVLRALDNSSITPRPVLDAVRAVAARADITLQTGVMGGGNDGSRFIPEGAIDCPLAWPQRCSHSRVETLDLRDLEALGRLVAAVALEFEAPVRK